MQHTMQALARGTALIGGVVLCAIIVMISLSIMGRASGLGEIKGAYELLEAGVAFAIFSFFPVCQLYGSHATVDVFTSKLPARANRALIAFWEVVLSVTLIFISLRLYEGMQRYIGNGETTFFLQFPVWWAYLASFLASCVTIVVAVYCAMMRVGESVTGRDLLPRD